MLLKTVLYLHQDTIPLTMITLKSVLNTKLLLILITKYLLLVDPMLATGQSIIAVFNRLMEEGSKEIHIAVVIAAPENSTP
jgi:uracil phosphoribosyltransferase